MKILKDGKNTPSRIELNKPITCHSCECQFEITEDDLETDKYSVRCPQCGCIIDLRIKTNDILYGIEMPHDLYLVIQDILDNFDFEKVEQTMSCLNWEWVIYGENFRQPSINELKKKAVELLVSAYKEKCCISTGGFTAEYQFYEEDNEYCLKLYFSVANDSCYWNNNENKIKYY